MIWVIGGTKDSRDFLEKFASDDKNIVVTTATEYGGRLLDGLPVKVLCKKLTKDEMKKFASENKVTTIVDISHPYAVEVSSNAIEVAKNLQLDYYRFEREEIKIYPQNYSEFYNIEDLIKYCETLNGNILITLGSNNIEKFKNSSNLNKYYFRILPKWDMVKRCEEFGILPKNIIAMQGPFSKKMNEAMIEQLNIKYLVTKRAGNTGGELEKIEACDSQNIEVIFLDRPAIIYPNKSNTIEELIEKIER